MANTISALVDDIYRSAEIIGKEGVGLLNSVQLNTGAESAPLNGTVNAIDTPEPTLNTSVTPAMTIPEGDDQTFALRTMTLGSVANVMINLTGEEEKSISVNHDFATVHGSRILRAMRKIRNQIESTACAAVYKAASRAYGTAGTTPFGSNFNEIPEVRQILFDNGFWEEGDMSLVINSLAGTNLRQLATLTGVNTAGTDSTLRTGELLNLSGFSIKESAGIASHTAGTGTSYQTSAAEAVDSTTINADTGSGTILAGDIVTFTGDSVNKYVVNTALAGGEFAIGEPGIRTAVADNTALAVGAAYTANLAVCSMAVEVAARPLASPSAGDAGELITSVADPLTGLVYEVRQYGGFHKSMWSISVVHGTKVWYPEGVAVLLG